MRIQSLSLGRIHPWAGASLGQSDPASVPALGVALPLVAPTAELGWCWELPLGSGMSLGFSG